MPLRQRDPVTGLLKRRPTGLLVQAIDDNPDCCGNEGCSGDCTGTAAPKCQPIGGGEPGTIYRTFRVTAEDVENASGWRGPLGAQARYVSGSINREYLVRLSPGPVAVSGGNPDRTDRPTLVGYFLTGLRSGAAGAPRYETGVPDPETISGELKWVLVLLALEEGGPNDLQKVRLVIRPASAGSEIFESGVVADSLLSDVDDFCRSPNVIDNAYTLASSTGTMGYEGTATIEPCPACAIECDPSDCAVITVTAGDDSVAEISGTYAATSGGDQLARYVAFGPFGPTGCAFAWVKVDPDSLAPFYGADNQPRHLYAWFDGRDWQSVVTKGTPGNNELPILFTRSAGDITCVEDTGKLTGEIDLEWDVVVAPPWAPQYVGLEASVTFGGCGTCSLTCAACCDFYAFTFSGTCAFPDIPHDVTLTNFGIGCEYVDLGGGASMSCEDGVLTLAANLGGGDYYWTATPDANGCPPTDPGAWTRHGACESGTTPTLAAITPGGCPS